MKIGSISAQNNINFSNPYHNNNEKRNYDEGKTSYAKNEIAHSEKISNMKRLISGANQKKNERSSIVEDTRKYGESIRNARNESKSTASQMKKLKYNFKDISSQIRKSKTSLSAKQVASKARREVIRLKMKIQTGKYDNEELEAAITHAKEMERAAKKKARHLEEEEMIKVTDGNGNGAGAVASELEQKLEEKMDADYKAAMEEAEQEREAEMEEASEEQIIEMEQAMQESIEDIRTMMEDTIAASVEEITEDMYDLLVESMEDMMEQTLGDLAESMMAVTDYEMSENEFTLFKLKHRASEDKTMLEADAKYLKAMFDIYDKRMGGGSNISGFSGAEAAQISVDTSANIPNVVDIAL